MKRIQLNTLQNVKNTLLAFGDTIEIFQFPERPIRTMSPTLSEINDENRRGIPEQNPFAQPLISSGAIEQKIPLPIVNALSTELFKELTNNYERLFPGSPYEDELALSIIKNAYISLDIDFEMAFAGANLESCFQNWKMKFNKQMVSLIREIIGIIDYATSLAPGTLRINKKFYNLKNEYDRAYTKKYGDSYSFNWNALSYRLANSELIPAYAYTIEKPSDEKWIKKEKMVAIDAAFTDNPLGYAWLEIHFSEKKNVKFSICTVCGGTFSLLGKRGNGLNKKNCGKEECRKELRRQNDERNRSDDLKKVRKKDLLRKYKSLAYQEIVVQKTTDAFGFAAKHGFPSNEVEDWITKRKIKEQEKSKKR